MRTIISLTILTTLIILLFGCSSLKTTTRLDLTPFANSMISVAGEIQYSLLQHQATHLATLEPGPSFNKFLVRKEKMRNIIRSIISYSIQIVTLGESNMPGAKKAAGLADYVEGVKRPVLKSPKPDLTLTPQQLDEIIGNVRQQKNLLDAIAAAQPIVNEISDEMGNLADEAKIFMDSAYHEISNAWKKKYEAVLWAENEVKAEQLLAIRALYHLKQFRTGEASSIDSVFITDPQLTEVVRPGKKVTSSDIMELEKRLVYKLSALSDMRKQFEPDILFFYKGLDELDRVHATYNKALRDARNSVILWSRAHNQLGKGVTDPAQIDILGLMMNTAKRASPIPIP
jgi:hypothetical protein